MLPLKSDGPCLLLLLSLIVADDYLFCCSIHFFLSSFCVVSINMLQHIISYQTIQSKQNNVNREKNKITVAYGNVFLLLLWQLPLLTVWLARYDCC